MCACSAVRTVRFTTDQRGLGASFVFNSVLNSLLYKFVHQKSFHPSSHSLDPSRTRICLRQGLGVRAQQMASDGSVTFLSYSLC